MQTISYSTLWLLTIAISLLLVYVIYLWAKQGKELERLQKSHNLLLETTQSLTKEMMKQKLETLLTDENKFLNLINFISSHVPHSLETVSNLIWLMASVGWDADKLTGYLKGLDKGEVDFTEFVRYILGFSIDGLTDEEINRIIKEEFTNKYGGNNEN